MTLDEQILEKLLEHIKLAAAYSSKPRNDVLCRVVELETELRALVKAESEPEGGDATCATKPYRSKLTSSPGPVASNPPSDVQAEGRGEARDAVISLIDKLYLEASEDYAELADSLRNDGVNTIQDAYVKGFHHALSELRMQIVTRKQSVHHKPHNPDNLPSPGEGYRFLDEDEVGAQWNRIPFIHAIERWEKPGWSASCWQGSIPVCTYRTRLTREQLAQKRKEAGK